MNPEAAQFLQNADDHLQRGQTMLATGLNYDAGRAAYLAAFHAAQALIFERTGGKVVKSHKGVNIEFSPSYEGRSSLYAGPARLSFPSL